MKLLKRAVLKLNTLIETPKILRTKESTFMKLKMNTIYHLPCYTKFNIMADREGIERDYIMDQGCLFNISKFYYLEIPGLCCPSSSATRPFMPLSYLDSSTINLFKTEVTNRPWNEKKESHS